MKIKYFLITFFTLFFILSVSSCAITEKIETFENDTFQIRDINLGTETAGINLFSATVANRTDKQKNLVVDLRTESIGLSRPNWQRQFFFRLQPNETKKIEFEYEIMTPLIIQIRLRFGESERYYDWEKRRKLPPEEREKYQPPKVNYLWTKTIPKRDTVGNKKAIKNLLDTYTIYLNDVTAKKLSEIKSKLPVLIKQSREAENPLRKKLDNLFQANRDYPQSFDFREETWDKKHPDLDLFFKENSVEVEVFSIAGEPGNRINAFFATRDKDANKEKPLILLLSGNPPGTKESLAAASIFFASFGYHTVGIDRRPSARKLDKKEKFLKNYSDPVCDLLRLLDYIQSQLKYKISKIGLYGFSAGAWEGKFAASFDDRINAVVLACGITSHNWMFKDRAWFPSYSGMIIFPELGLGSPDIANLTSEQFWENFNKVQPEHNQKAREIFNKVFPYFEDMDPLKVTPLIAPVPLMIISGAQDDQFRASGVVAVDEAVQKAYQEFGLLSCSELYIQPRVGHRIDTKGGFVIASFFERWLK